MKNTFWELEMSPEELEFTVQLRRRRAYTDVCLEYSSIFGSSGLRSSTPTDFGSPTSTETGGCSSPVSSGSQGCDASDRWADICDTDDDSPLPPSPPSRPEGTWILPPSPPSLETQMAAAVGKAKERAAVEAKVAGAKGKAQTPEKPEKQQKVLVICDPCDRTTLVLRKLPKNYTRTSLLEMLDAAGLQGLYDFAYLPMDFKKGKVFGHAIVNFATNDSAEKANSYFAGAGVNIEWCDSHQGLEDLIQRYRDSPIMHPSMPEITKPIMFCNGLVAPFPSPTKEVEPLSKN